MFNLIFGDNAPGWRWRRFKRQAKTTLLLTTILTAAIVSSAWSTMITVGNLHAWWPHVPTMSFGTAITIVAAPFFIAAVWQAIVQTLKS
jgi:hypothetical protein